MYAALLAAALGCALLPAAHATASHELDMLQWYAFDLVNTERELRGLDRVQMSGVDSAQARAQDALLSGGAGPFDSGGYGPQDVYCLAGGTGRVLENIGRAGGRDNPGDKIARLTGSWMEEDMPAGWAHMDAILDPRLTHANFGIAWDGHEAVFVQHLEIRDLEWEHAGTQGGWFYLAGPQQSSIAGLKLESAREPEPSRIAVGADEPGVRWRQVENALPRGDVSGGPGGGWFAQWYYGQGSAVVWYHLPDLDPRKIYRITVWDQLGYESVHALPRPSL